MNPSVIKFIQRELGARPIDGIYGPSTDRAVVGFLRRFLSDHNPLNWTWDRKATIAIQVMAKSKEIDPGPLDGYWGQVTEEAYDELYLLIETGKRSDNFRDKEEPADAPTELTLNTFPVQTESELIKVYGQPGDASKQTYVNLPYMMKLAWDLDTKVRRVKCHELVAPSLAEILQDVSDTYSVKEIQDLGLDLYGGMLNVRKMRGGSKWSMHAWGIAIDIDPANNRLRWGKDKARLAGPEYDEWWQIWEEQGWVSLGRVKNYDFQHIQAARLK